MTERELDTLNVGDIVFYSNTVVEESGEEPPHGFIRAITKDYEGKRKVFYVQYFHNPMSNPSISLSNMKYWFFAS
jgi:hypothetical protein